MDSIIERVDEAQKWLVYAMGRPPAGVGGQHCGEQPGLTEEGRHLPDARPCSAPMFGANFGGRSS